MPSGTGLSLLARPSAPFLRLPDGWDTAWKAAKAASATSPRWVTLIGDSVGLGAAATNFFTGSFFHLLKTTILARGYSNHGEHWMTGENAATVGVYNGTAPWTMNVTPPTTIIMGTGLTPLWNAAPANPFATFVMPSGYNYTYTQLELVFGNAYVAAASQFTFTVDSTSDPTLTTFPTITGFSAGKSFSTPTVTITVTLPANTDLQPPMRVRLTGLQNINHTLKLTTQTGANVAEAWGVSVYQNPTLGLGWAKCAPNGGKAMDWVSNESCQPRWRARLWQGYTTVSQNDVGFGFPFQPALAIIQLGINDCQNLVDLDHYEHGLRRLCQSLRRGYDNCSILFLHGFVADGENSDQTNNYMNPQNYQHYGDRIYAVADDFNAAVYNFQAKWGELGLAGGEVSGVDSHPVDAGHAEIATTLASVL